MLHMLVTMSNTHIEGGDGAEKRRKRKRGRGLRQWQRAPRAPREKQVGAVNDEREWGWGQGDERHELGGFKAVADDISLGNEGWLEEEEDEQEWVLTPVPKRGHN